MATGHGWGGASRTGSNHPALACASTARSTPGGTGAPRTFAPVSAGSIQRSEPIRKTTFRRWLL